MKKFTVQVLLLLGAIAIGLFLYSPNTLGTIDLPFLPQSPKIANLQINNMILKVEVADTPTKRSKGLGGRTSLPQDQGMLFIFDKADKYPFWMKGLSFPLDFVWIKDDKVVDILPNIPPPVPNQKDTDLPVYSAKVEIDKVLEINGGMAQKLNIQVGDSVKLQ
ncbi:DUF192 domain-containing protein [Candidatus Daviesbacteria bacterium]|nr:DUF192 domain-containing protein [Candidatus Daviesbacteria bacterium]